MRYLLNSHAHLDHSGGLAQLKKDTGAKLVASQGDRSALEGGFYLGSEQRHDLDVPPVKVDRIVNDGDEVVVGDVHVKALLTPGHTRGCTTWTTRVLENGRPLTVLFHCSTSVALNRIVPPLQYEGIVQDYERSFAKLKTVQADVFLSPHPEYFRMQEKLAQLGQGRNPFVDPSELPTFTRQSEAEFRQELAKQGAAAKKPPYSLRRRVFSPSRKDSNPTKPACWPRALRPR